MATGKTTNSIEELSSAVFDNGRRGQPKPGCDCVQCFGYCMIDGDAALRQSFERHDASVGSDDE